MSVLKLFHTGFYIIESPDIHFGKKNADFGQGFYLSDDEDFSHRWARISANGPTYMNCYELELTGLKVKQLERDEEWFGYIFNNRRGLEDRLAEYDVIMGPIANDTIYNVMGVTTSGLLEDSAALELLELGPVYRQIAIKSERAKEQLRWTGCETLEASALHEYRELVESEETAFLEAVAEKLNELL